MSDKHLESWLEFQEYCKKDYAHLSPYGKMLFYVSELNALIQKLQAENDKLKSDLIEIEVGYILTAASKIENGEGDKDYFIYKAATVCKKYGVSLVIANLKDRQQTPLIQWCVDLINELNKEELKERKDA